MKRLSLVALLLAGSVAAVHADNDIYTNMSKQKRGDDALHADAAVCDAELGRRRTARRRRGHTRAACAPAAGASATPSASRAVATTAIPTPTIPASSATTSRSAASPDRAARIFEGRRCGVCHRHPEEPALAGVSKDERPGWWPSTLRDALRAPQGDGVVASMKKAKRPAGAAAGR